MDTANLKKLEIISNLSFVPTEKLDEINNFVQYVLYASQAKKKKKVSVRGIWKNKGFEKIDVEKELKTLRREIQKNLDKKDY
ncbi:MAG: hypothetical protein KAT34_08240 [Candidatus Aminicenantes bacterium]|nr:hypothetical protein [Candidatus Aminicenantes bacterium]